MKVILLSDVKKLGKKGDIVEVSDGYGRNFLLNKNLAVMATKKSMEILDEQNLQHDLEESWHSCMKNTAFMWTRERSSTTMPSPLLAIRMSRWIFTEIR